MILLLALQGREKSCVRHPQASYWLSDLQVMKTAFHIYIYMCQVYTVIVTVIKLTRHV